MPRMPTEESIGFNLPRSQGVPSQRRDIIGQSVAQAGQTVARVGELIGDEAARNLANDRAIALKQKTEDDALDLARARADWNKRRLTEDDNYQLDKNPNYSTWEKGYAKNIDNHRKLSAGIIRNPKLREKFEIETGDDVVSGTLAVRNRAKGIDRDTQVTQAVQGLDDSIDLAARPGTDPKTANSILSQARANIDNMQETGVITPGKAMELRRSVGKRFAKIKVSQDIQDNPLAASSWLEGGEGGAVGLIRRHEGYRARPYYDKTAYRVGYGSDTVTMEDGTVIKVTPGMEITKADAERDLKRRIGEFQGGIIKEIGSEAWAQIPASAQAALTSVAYNYGSLPASVVTAIKTRDLGQVSEAVRALQTHNQGINAKRRNNEADIIASGENDIKDLTPPEYYSVLDAEDRMSLQSAADAEWTARQKEVREATAVERYQIQQSIDNDITQIRETGKATDIDPQTVANTLGEDDVAKWLDKRRTAADTFAAVSVLETMTNEQIEEHLTALEPKAGAPEFARGQSVYDAAEKRANDLLNLRSKDPAKSVDDSPLVANAWKEFKPDQPESIQGVIGARLAAQGQVGIPKAMQKPVTRREAYDIIAPVQSIIDQAAAREVMALSKAKTPAERKAMREAAKAQTNAEILSVLDMVEKTYGPYSQDVMAFAIAESVRDKEIGEITSGIYKKILNKEKITQQDNAALDNATEASTAEKAMNGELTPPKPQQPPQRTPQPASGRGGDRKEPTVKPPPGGWPFVDPRDVDKLIANPELAPQFDAIFGPGSAAKWMPKTPKE